MEVKPLFCLGNDKGNLSSTHNNVFERNFCIYATEGGIKKRRNCLKGQAHCHVIKMGERSGIDL